MQTDFNAGEIFSTAASVCFMGAVGSLIFEGIEMIPAIIIGCITLYFIYLFLKVLDS